jgi:ABC-type Fe3+-siderophore transport system permease subunit
MKKMNSKLARFGRNAVYLNIFGIIFSGLVFPVLTAIFYPQPLWQSPDLFIESFHPLQTATFFCGYFLVIGSLLTFLVLYLTSNETKKIWALSGLAINIVFTAIVFLNYIIQNYTKHLCSLPCHQQSA